MGRVNVKSKHCEEHKQIKFIGGEEIQVFCVEKKYHVFKNLRTLREFVQMDSDKRIILCPEYFDYKKYKEERWIKYGL